jgi:hypothetical protein
MKWGMIFVALAACGAKPLVCKQDSECGPAGVCRQDRCAVTDERCAGRLRWAGNAGRGERCVESPAGEEQLSDGFDEATLSPAWKVWGAEQSRFEVRGGELHMTPTTNCVWWRKLTGPGLYKHVAGDFRVTTSVKVRSAKDPSQPPPLKFQFGGLVARDPGAKEENWVFAVVGEREGYYALESKTTVDGKSKINAPDWGKMADAELRICRLGARMLLLARKPGGTWETQGDHRRDDFPAVLEVGPIAYTYTDTPDLVASFDRVEFAPVSSEADCRAE